MKDSQPKSFFRFRSTDALLGHFQELEQQQIYFASLDELNDPLEGFKDVFWRGDVILWENLLRHYLLCLTHAVMAAHIKGQDHEFNDFSEYAFANESTVPTKDFRKLHSEICVLFFRHPDMEALPRVLEDRGGVIRSEELTSYLRLLHLHAINVVLTCAETASLLPRRPDDDPIRLASEKDIPVATVLDTLKKGEELHKERPDFAEVMSGISEASSLQLELIHEYNGISLQKGKAWKVLVGEFPRLYVRALQQLMYRDWYTACFVTDPCNSAMWGNYADGHKGVCLKFSTTLNSAGSLSLRLKQIVGWRGGGGTEPEPVHGDAVHEFQRVSYSGEFIEIDFFRSLGRLTMPMLNHWYRDRKGAISPFVEDVVAESDVWRSKYWGQINAVMTTKLHDWSHEQEFRLTLHSSISDLEDRSTRKLEYHFSDLEGIIFGIKTPTSEKLRIIKIIEAKCRRDGRSSFEFYQARYSRRVGKVEISQMSLLKFAGL
jgi:hypothetical protein